MNAEPIIPLCSHIKTNGRPCRSPALHGETLCFFHNRLRLTHQRPQSAMALTSYSQEYAILSEGGGSEEDPFAVARAYPHQDEIEFPPLEDAESVQLATSMLFQAIATGQIHFKRARLLLYTLKIAVINQRALTRSRAADAADDTASGVAPSVGAASGFTASSIAQSVGAASGFTASGVAQSAGAASGFTASSIALSAGAASGFTASSVAPSAGVAAGFSPRETVTPNKKGALAPGTAADPVGVFVKGTASAVPRCSVRSAASAAEVTAPTNPHAVHILPATPANPVSCA